MKFQRKLNYLPFLSVLLGGLGVLLRFWLYRTGLDEDRLLVAHHPAAILVLLLTLAVIAALVPLTRACHPREKYADFFPANIPAGAGAMICGLTVLLTALFELVRRENSLFLITGLLGIAAAGALCLTGLYRMKGSRPSFVLHLTICLFFLIWLIDRYQLWSSDPQLQDYSFQLLATVCAMLYSYHRAEFDLHCGSVRRLVLFGLLGIYFCCLSVVHSATPLIYCGTALWMITNSGALQAAPQEES